jgi:uncharacterized membrane protein
MRSILVFLAVFGFFVAGGFFLCAASGLTWGTTTYGQQMGRVMLLGLVFSFVAAVADGIYGDRL